MKQSHYPCPLAAGGSVDELALTFDAGNEIRVLVAPALFDEANKLRHFTVETMRRLAGAGIDSFLPDLPGCNESPQDLAGIEPEDWSTALGAAARHFGANRLLAIRGGGLVAPPALAGWHYGPVKGSSLLRTMLRARVLNAQEAGRGEKLEGLLATGVASGIELAGYGLSAELIRQLQALQPPERGNLMQIDQEMLGGGSLWLRAEPDYDAEQADALAAVIAMGSKA